MIPLLLVWFGLGDTSKAVLVFLGCLLPVVLSTYNGIAGVDHVLVWSARSMGASRAAIVWDVLLPAASPAILTGIRTAIAFMFLLMVSSELVIATNGLGYLIGSLGDGGNYPAMFAVILTVTVLGYAADRGFLTLSGSLAAVAGVSRRVAPPMVDRRKPVRGRGGVGGGVVGGWKHWELVDPFLLPPLPAVLDRLAEDVIGWGLLDECRA